MFNATIHTFKRSGKYYTSERGMSLLIEDHIKEDKTTRQKILDANNGLIPGLSTTGYDYFIVLIPDDDIDDAFVSYPIHCSIG